MNYKATTDTLAHYLKMAPPNPNPEIQGACDALASALEELETRIRFVTQAHDRFSTAIDNRVTALEGAVAPKPATKPTNWRVFGLGPLPDYDERVLVRAGGSPHVAVLELTVNEDGEPIGHHWRDVWTCQAIKDVTHWCPIPK